MRRGLTRTWSIDLDESFQARVVDGSLQLVSPGPPRCTIWVNVWNPPEDETPDQVLAPILEDAHPHPDQQFQETGADAAEIRFASWYPEDVEGTTQWGLYAYTIRPGSYVQAAFLCDTADELDWALAAWRSLRFTPPDPEA